MAYKAGDLFPIWFPPFPDSVKVDGYYQAPIIEVRPYTGRYPQYFTQVIKLPAWRTNRGWLETVA